MTTTPAPKRRAWFRADASPSIGAGHVVRCLTIARQLVEGGWAVHLATRALPPTLIERAHRIGVSVVPLDVGIGGLAEADLLMSDCPEMVVLDGYAFEPALHDALAELEAPVLLVDDNRESPAHCARAVLNQNPHATADMYAELAPEVHLLLGREFALIRPEVLAAKSVPRLRDRVPQVFVSIGGSDVLGMNPRIAEALGVMGGIQVVVPGNAKSMELPEIAELMAVADIAVVGAGTTLWESLFLGVPTIGVVVAPNQIAPARFAEEAGVARIVSGDDDDATEQVVSQVRELLSQPDACATLSQGGEAFIDGLGASRVVARLEEIFK